MPVLIVLAGACLGVLVEAFLPRRARYVTQVTLTVLEHNLPRMSTGDRWGSGDRVRIGWLPEHTVLLK